MMFEKMPDYLICEAKVGETEAYLAEEERAVGEWMREGGEQSRQGSGEVLAQYECAECAEEHYHTRRQVRPCFTPCSPSCPWWSSRDTSLPTLCHRPSDQWVNQPILSDDQFSPAKNQ